MAVPAQTVNCPMCEPPIGAAAKFCSNCGMPLGKGAAPPASVKPKWYYNIWFTLFLLFFVLGPLALPMVWKNPRFSQPVKIMLTVSMILFCFVFIKLLTQLYSTVSYQLEQLDASMRF